MRGLEEQTWPVHRLIVMNTGKENWRRLMKTTIPMEVRPSDQRGIRSWKDKGSGGADEPGRLSAVYDSGDALPEDCHLIEKLVEAMEQDEKNRRRLCQNCAATGRTAG